LFGWSCGLVVRIFLSSFCGDMVVDIRVWLILVFVSPSTFRTVEEVTRIKPMFHKNVTACMRLIFQAHNIKDMHTVTLCTYWSLGRRLCMVFTFYNDNCYVFLHS
jgi:hypothetical protein